MGNGELIALCGLGLNIVVAIVGCTWGIGKIRDTVRAEIETHREKFAGQIDALEMRYGDSIAALRQKVADVELWAANNYVRRDGFYKVQEQLSQEFRNMRESMEGRFQRIEEQISHLRGT
jgi:hypothetical protein